MIWWIFSTWSKLGMVFMSDKNGVTSMQIKQPPGQGEMDFCLVLVNYMLLVPSKTWYDNWPLDNKICQTYIRVHPPRISIKPLFSKPFPGRKRSNVLSLWAFHIRTPSLHCTWPRWVWSPSSSNGLIVPLKENRQKLQILRHFRRIQHEHVIIHVFLEYTVCIFWGICFMLLVHCGNNWPLTTAFVRRGSLGGSADLLSQRPVALSQ